MLTTEVQILPEQAFGDGVEVAHDRQRTVGDAGRRQLDAVVRAQILEALPGELAARSADTPDLLAAFLSQASWTHMRSTQGHGVERATALLEAAVLRLLGEESGER